MPDSYEAPAKRQYLSAESRRESILRVADEVLSKEGIAHLSIVEVARRAGISRQLIYQHFADLNTLLNEVIRMRFAEMQQTLALAEGVDDLEIRDLVQRQLLRVLRLPNRDRQLLRNLFGDITAVPRDLWPTMSDIRHVLVTRWTNLIDPRNTPSPLSYAKMGLILHAILGAWDLIIDGSLSEEEALALLMKVTESLFVVPW